MRSGAPTATCLPTPTGNWAGRRPSELVDRLAVRSRQPNLWLRRGSAMESVDVIVIGTGSAAQTVAYTCREAGWSVAVIDSRPFGGTCALRGCDPKKVLVGISELVDWSHRMQGNGVSAPALSIDWPDLIRFKRTFTDPAPEQNEKGFAEA